MTNYNTYLDQAALVQGKNSVEYEKILRELLDKSPAENFVSLRGRIQLAKHLTWKGEFEEAGKHFKTIEEHAKTLKSLPHRIAALTGLGHIEMHKEFYDKATDYLFEALSLEVEDYLSETHGLLYLIYQIEGEFDKSFQHLNSCETISKTTGIPEQLCFAHLMRGHFWLSIDRYTDALKSFNECVNIARVNFIPQFEAYALAYSGDVFRDIHIFEESIRLYKYSQDICSHHHFEFLRIAFKWRHAASLEGSGRFDEAIDKYMSCANVAKDGNHLMLNVRVLNMLQAAYKLNDQDKESRQILNLIAKNQAALIQQKANEQVGELLELKEREIRALKAKNQSFTHQTEEFRELKSVLVHDLREPLRNISGFATLIEKNDKEHLNEESLEYLKFIHSNIESLDVLLKKMLDFVAVDAMSGDTLVKTDLGLLMKVAFTEKRKAYKKPKAELIIPDNLPTEIIVSKDFLADAFLEIFDNSFKFQSAEELRIEVDFEELETSYVLVVKDNGLGFENIYSDKIIHLFRQLNRDVSGIGFGLSYARKIIQQHGGQLYLQSEPNKGTQIRITLGKF